MSRKLLLRSVLITTALMFHAAVGSPLASMPEPAAQATDLPHGTVPLAPNTATERQSNDTAWHIQTVDSAGDVGSETSIAADSAGHVHISYYYSTNGDLKYTHWTGHVWEIKTVDSDDRVGSGISIALDSADNPHISYIDHTSHHLKYAHKAGGIWVIHSVDIWADVGWSSSIALDSASNPHISYFDDTDNDLRYVRWTGSGSRPQIVDRDGYVGGVSSIALDRLDNPHISYNDWTDGWASANLKYARWTGSAWTIQVVDSAVGTISSIALDSTGNAHISYFDDTDNDLKYAHWTGVDWVIQTVDSDGYVGRVSSIALDRLDNPHISYYDWTNGDLKYARWMGGGWAIQRVDSEGDVGRGTSIAVDSAGNPHISYYDRTNGDLKYAMGRPSVELTSTPTSTLMPTPLPTLTPTATRTEVLFPTITATATRPSSDAYVPLIVRYLAPLPTPTLSPTPSVICDAGFEAGHFAPCWDHGGELAQRVVDRLDTGEPPFAGHYSALLGQPELGSGNNGNIPAGSAWIQQRIQVPNTAQPRLAFQYRVISYDASLGSAGQLWDTLDATIDGELVFRDDEGQARPHDRPHERHDTRWQRAEVGLSRWRGQEVVLRFAVWNREYDGNGMDYYNTWAYLAEVEVEP